MRTLLKQFSYASLVWIFLFLIDYGIELFQMENEERVTLMGLYIKSTETREGLYTVFGFTPRIITVFIGFVLVWGLISVFLTKK